MDSSRPLTLKGRKDEVGRPIGLPVDDFQSPARLPDPDHILKGKHVHLEPIRESHIDGLWESFSADQSSTWAYLSVGPWESESDFKSFIKTKMVGSKDPFPYAIVPVGEEKRVVGFATLMRGDAVNGTIEIGWVTFAACMQRTCMATETFYLMMHHVFEDLGHRRLEWKCDSMNEKSRNAAHRLGMSFDGVFKHARFYKGRNRDTAWFSLIKDDWPTVNSAMNRWLSPDNFEAGKQKERLSELTAPAVYSRWPVLRISVDIEE